ncbi:MAG: uroporphyrinogen decarboxylase [Acetobacteraceae bacterium]|nr:uroporphyrinogen decarboxylase [Acetobacteraceae bacterium]
MRKRLLRTLAGEAVWPPPVWLMRQAGRYLPEYRALREKAGSFIQLCMSPDLAAEVTLQPVRRYGFDAAILFSDILILPWALGYGLDFIEGEGPVLPRLRDSAGVEALRPERLNEAIAPILETVRRVRASLDEATALIGFAGGPFTVACYMVEGGGSRDFAVIRRMAFEEPRLLGRLMALLTEATVEYLALQIEAGAEAVMLFDSWAGVLPPSLFRAHVTGPARLIARVLKERFPSVPVIGFPRLAGVMLGDYGQLAGMQGIGMDTAMDPARAMWLVPHRTALQGNLDPVALAAGGPAMRDETRAILLAMRGRPFIFNLGHGILPHTSPEHVAELVALVRKA